MFMSWVLLFTLSALSAAPNILGMCVCALVTSAEKATRQTGENRHVSNSHRQDTQNLQSGRRSACGAPWRRRAHQKAAGAIMRAEGILEVGAGELQAPEEAREPKASLVRSGSVVWVCLSNLDTYIREVNFLWVTCSFAEEQPGIHE